MHQHVKNGYDWLNSYGDREFLEYPKNPKWPPKYQISISFEILIVQVLIYIYKKFEPDMYSGSGEEDFFRFWKNPRWPPRHITIINQNMWKRFRMRWGIFLVSFMILALTVYDL